MKRFFGVGIGLFLVFAMSVSAWAAIDVKGQILFDSYYYHQDAAGYARPGYTAMKTQPGSGGIAGIRQGTTTTAEDRNQTFFEINHGTALRFNWANQTGLGAFVAIYMNSSPTQSLGTDAGFKVGVSTAFLYFHVNKDFVIAAGKGGYTQVFSPFDPGTLMGYDGVCKVRGLGYGNINSSYEENIRFIYSIGKTAKIDLALINPRMTGDATNGFVPTTGNAVDNNSKIPKIEFGIPLTFKGNWGKIDITPSAMYLRQEFGNVTAGHDNTITSYGLSAGISVKVKGLRFQAEYNYGQNLINAGKSGEATSYPFKYEYIVGGLAGAMGAYSVNGTIYNAKTNAFWVELGYNIADRVTPTIFYGRHNSKRDMLTSFDSDFTTQMYGINAPITLFKYLTIVPEFVVYDNGNSNKINGTTYDFGKEWLAGIQWRIFF